MCLLQIRNYTDCTGGVTAFFSFSVSWDTTPNARCVPPRHHQIGFESPWHYTYLKTKRPLRCSITLVSYFLFPRFFLSPTSGFGYFSFVFLVLLIRVFFFHLSEPEICNFFRCHVTVLGVPPSRAKAPSIGKNFKPVRHCTQLPIIASQARASWSAYFRVVFTFMLYFVHAFLNAFPTCYVPFFSFFCPLLSQGMTDCPRVILHAPTRRSAGNRELFFFWTRPSDTGCRKASLNTNRKAAIISNSHVLTQKKTEGKGGMWSILFISPRKHRTTFCCCFCSFLRGSVDWVPLFFLFSYCFF